MSYTPNIGWWSGGVTSAVACKEMLNIYGLQNCRIIMIDTKNEHPDTYRFKQDCEHWYGIEIETITGIGTKYSCIQDVWRKFLSLNVANGAICSTELKRIIRENWQKWNKYDRQIFGYEFVKSEFNRAKSMTLNHPDSKPIYPLLMLGYDKPDCFKIVEDAGIKVPESYSEGFNNNNCYQTGCVQGGIGYWQKMQRDRIDAFNEMADIEHELTDKKGMPVTMLKDQSNAAKELAKKDKKLQLVFLKKHPDYPQLKCLADMAPQKVKPLFECNGFCGTNDLNPNKETESEINYEGHSLN